MALEYSFGPDDVRVGHTYALALARGIITTATVVFERVGSDGTRFVRFASPSLKQPGYCSADLFAQGVRAARGESLG
jgi:hypothetical protein